MVAAALLLAGHGNSLVAETVQDWLDLPPAFVRLFGDPVIDQKTGDSDSVGIRLYGVGNFSPKNGFSRRVYRPRVVITSSSRKGNSEALDALARAMSERFFDEVIARKNLTRHEKLIEMQELIPMTREQFTRMSTKRLMSQKGYPDWFETWWQIRMGLPLHQDPDHQLLVINLHYDREDGKQRAGHFALGIREVGGNPNRDLAFDFRAEWYLDRRATLIEALNLNNELPLRGYSKNLYDWLYTQTEYRNCHADLWFLPIYREQVRMLRHFVEEVGVHESGQFKPVRRNCTTLGLAFLDRLKPFRSELPLGKGIADIPTTAAYRYVEPYNAPHFRLTNYTDDRGRKPTVKSKILPASPSRAASRPYRELRKLAFAN